MSLTGRVSRWMNRKGYGFVNVVTPDSEHNGNDLFVHLSGINMDENQYKSLFPGEYVSFDVLTGEDGRHTCVNLTGVHGGPLLVENSDYRYKVYPKNRDRQSVENVSEEVSNVVDEEVSNVVDEEVSNVVDEVVDEVVDSTQ